MQTVDIHYLFQCLLLPDHYCDLQNNMVHLLEAALLDETGKASEPLQSCSIESLVDILPMASDDSGCMHFGDHINGSSQGTILYLFWGERECF